MSDFARFPAKKYLTEQPPLFCQTYLGRFTVNPPRKSHCNITPSGGSVYLREALAFLPRIKQYEIPQFWMTFYEVVTLLIILNLIIRGQLKIS